MQGGAGIEGMLSFDGITALDKVSKSKSTINSQNLTSRHAPVFRNHPSVSSQMPRSDQRQRNSDTGSGSWIETSPDKVFGHRPAGAADAREPDGL